jgi:hypothetical protein
MAKTVNMRILRRKYMNGIGRWINKNQRREYLLDLDLRCPKGRFIANVKAASAPRTK